MNQFLCRNRSEVEYFIIILCFITVHSQYVQLIHWNFFFFCYFQKNAKVNFDPLQEHRCWCVWVNSFPCTEEMDKPAGSMHTVVGSEHEPAWRVMRDNLLPEVSPVKEDAVHMIKTVRIVTLVGV